jgi:nucleotide-binding universal stress UspA family protein
MQTAMRAVLVHLDASAECALRLQLARRIAERHGARVSTLFAVRSGTEALPATYSAVALAEAALHHDVHGCARARAAVERMVALGGDPVDWSETHDESPLAALSHRARFADLVVVGKRDPAGAHVDQLPARFAEEVALRSGRPVLVVPDHLAQADAPRRIVVAWKASRESARAVEAALPLLRDADAVQVLAWQDEEPPAGSPGLSRLGEWLRRQRVNAMLHELGRAPSDLGDALMAQARRHQADLLVMGCYGRSRVSELLFGGASRTVLRQVPLPVLLSH